MKDLEAFAMALPGTTREVTDDDRPSYRVAGKLYCCHRRPRQDAVDASDGTMLNDVLMFRVADLDTKDALLADPGSRFFTTSHFDGYPAVLLMIRDLRKMPKDELFEIVADAWLTKAPKRVAAAWLKEHGA